MTGSSDGVVRMWSLDFIEVPITEKDKALGISNETSTHIGADKVVDESPTPTMLQSLTQQLARKISANCESGGTNDTLKNLQEILAANVYVTTPLPERKNQEANHVQSEEDPSSDTENCEHQNDDTLDNTSEVGADIEEEKSIFDTTTMEDDKEATPTCDNGEDHIDGDGRDRLNSESSVQTTGNVASDFVVVSNDEITRNEEMDEADEDESYGNALGSCGGRRRRRRLQSDGYTWRRQLLFRAKLTMHTAFERPDNIDPAAVTALAVSKDHRTIYVGDEKGRVFSWSVSSRPGKGIFTIWLELALILL